MRDYAINVKGRLLSLKTPQIMGILNITPDSFYEGSRAIEPSKMLQLAENMLQNGATILDIGGMSTKPFADEISLNDEISRVIPAIEAIHDKFPDAILSVDTYRSKVATAAIAAGASIVNDISGGELDNDMLPTVAKLNVPYICMHMQGTPQTMQNNPSYHDVVLEIFQDLQKKINKCRDAGIKDIIIDPGFGFGKTMEQNYQLLHHLDFFGQLDCPILVGVSRKGMIYKPLNCSQNNALAGTITANTLALVKGAHILRVHDVKETADCIEIFNCYKRDSA